MNEETIVKIYQFIKLLNEMKLVNRLTLLSKDGRRESDAEHCWHVAISAMLIAPIYDKPIDLSRAIQMALVHDIVEIYAGDVYAFASDEERSKKQEREQAAAEKLFSQLPEPQDKSMKELWEEYELRESEESKFVSAIDKLMPYIQFRIAHGDALPSDAPSNDARKKAQVETLRATSPVFGLLYDKIIEEKV